LGKYVAVTSLDSGPLFLSEEEKIAGWQSRNDIAYSPQVQLPDQLPHGGFDEWYVFDSPKDLGQLWRGNVFETPKAAGHIADFVNFGDFAPHNPEVQALLSLFWEQLERIQPESYVADGNAFLTFVSRDKQIFAAVCRAMTDVPASSWFSPKKENGTHERQSGQDLQVGIAETTARHAVRPGHLDVASGR
jgi:hypothetical protein